MSEEMTGTELIEKLEKMQKDAEDQLEDGKLHGDDIKEWCYRTIAIHIEDIIELVHPYVQRMERELDKANNASRFAILALARVWQDIKK